MSQPKLSLVIPVFNEAERLPATLDRCFEYLNGRDYSFEIIVVNDGSVDGTSEVVRSRMQKWGSSIREIRFDSNHGKGHAVKAGLMDAKGEVAFFSDADLSTPIRELEKMLPFFDEGVDIAIASRRVSGPDVDMNRSLRRAFAGRVFSSLVRLLVLPGIFDSQCGFKGFARRTIEPITSRQRLSGFAFDVEILLIAKRLGFSIKEVPVDWHDDARSKIKLMKDGAAMLLDLLKIRFLHRKTA